MQFIMVSDLTLKFMVLSETKSLHLYQLMIHLEDMEIWIVNLGIIVQYDKDNVRSNCYFVLT